MELEKYEISFAVDIMIFQTFDLSFIFTPQAYYQVTKWPVPSLLVHSVDTNSINLQWMWVPIPSECDQYFSGSV